MGSTETISDSDLLDKRIGATVSWQNRDAGSGELKRALETTGPVTFELDGQKTDLRLIDGAVRVFATSLEGNEGWRPLFGKRFVDVVGSDECNRALTAVVANRIRRRAFDGLREIGDNRAALSAVSEADEHRLSREPFDRIRKDLAAQVAAGCDWRQLMVANQDLVDSVNESGETVEKSLKESAASIAAQLVEQMPDMFSHGWWHLGDGVQCASAPARDSYTVVRGRGKGSKIIVENPALYGVSADAPTVRYRFTPPPQTIYHGRVVAKLTQADYESVDDYGHASRLPDGRPAATLRACKVLLRGRAHLIDQLAVHYDVAALAGTNPGAVVAVAPTERQLWALTRNLPRISRRVSAAVWVVGIVATAFLTHVIPAAPLVAVAVQWTGIWNFNREVYSRTFDGLRPKIGMRRVPIVKASGGVRRVVENKQVLLDPPRRNRVVRALASG